MYKNKWSMKGNHQANCILYTSQRHISAMVKKVAVLTWEIATVLTRTLTAWAYSYNRTTFQCMGIVEVSEELARNRKEHFPNLPFRDILALQNLIVPSCLRCAFAMSLVLPSIFGTQVVSLLTLQAKLLPCVPGDLCHGMFSYLLVRSGYSEAGEPMVTSKMKVTVPRTNLTCKPVINRLAVHEKCVSSAVFIVIVKIGCEAGYSRQWVPYRIFCNGAPQWPSRPTP